MGNHGEGTYFCCTGSNQTSHLYCFNSVNIVIMHQCHSVQYERGHAMSELITSGRWKMDR